MATTVPVADRCARGSRNARVDPLVPGDLQDFVAERIVSDRGNQRGGDAELREMRRHVEGRAARVSAGGQAVPEDFAEGVEFLAFMTGEGTEALALAASLCSMKRVG